MTNEVNEKGEVTSVLPSKERLEEIGYEFGEFRNYLHELQANAWYSRTEGRAFRMLLDQLGGAVRLDIKGDPTPSDCLHLGTGGVIATSAKAMDWPENPVPARLLAQAPHLLQCLKTILDIAERRELVDPEGLRRIIKSVEEAQ